jgi:outer membrane lipoprotein-sorting protein
MKKKFFLAILFIFFLKGGLSEENKAIQILKSAEEKCKNIKDYRCIFEYTEIKNGKKSYRECEFSFVKNTGLRKMKVIDGENKGVILLYRPDEDKEKVKVKQIIPLTLDKNDKRIEGFFSSDFSSDIYYLKYHLNKGKINYLREEKFLNKMCHLLEFIAGKNTEYTKALLWIDKKILVPVKIEKYVGSELFSQKVYKKIEINIGLTPEDFEF